MQNGQRFRLTKDGRDEVKTGSKRGSQRAGSQKGSKKASGMMICYLSLKALFIS
jgi:hypothetical protein